MRSRRDHAPRARSSRSTSPARCWPGSASEIVELRVDGDGPAALAALRARGVAGDDAFAVGSTLTVPLHDRTRRAGGRRDGRAVAHGSGITTRTPTLDDVYLQLTGGRAISEAA